VTEQAANPQLAGEGPTPDPARPDGVPAAARRRGGGRFTQLGTRGPAIGFGLLFVVLFAVFSLLKPDAFFTSSNVKSILATSVVAMLLSMGLVFVLVVRDFDLSIASNAALAGSAAVLAMSKLGQPTGVAFLIAVGVGVLGGAVNGLIVAFFNANALITTLATTSVFAGIQEWLTKSGTVSTGINHSYLNLTAQQLAGWPVDVGVVVVLAVVTAIGIRTSVFGRHAYATGANQPAARLAGVRTAAVRFWSFVLVGLFAGLAGICLTSLAGGTPQAGSTNTYLLPAYAAAFLGAITVGRGNFTILAAVLGVLFVNMLQVGLIVVEAPLFTTDLISGLILVGAVLISRTSASHVSLN
jgi:ribose transport system permease protein